MNHQKGCIKLLFVIDSLRFGGAERQLTELVKGLDRKRFSITVVSLKKEVQSYAPIIEELGIELLYVQRHARFDVSPVFGLMKLIRERKIDVVHAMLSLGGVFGVAAARLAGIPVVCSVIREGKDPNFKLRCYRKMLAPFSDLYVSNSYAGLANRFKKMHPNFRVVYNGFDLRRFKLMSDAECSELRFELGLADDALIVGMVASLSPYKDQATLIRCIAELRRVYPSLCAVFVGDGSEREHLEELAAELGAGEYVRFLGYRNDVDRLVQIFDVAVLLSNPSQHLEGISNSLAEAMANGIPVIGSKGGGTDELIEDGVSGLLVEPLSVGATSAALRRLLDEPVFARRLAENGAHRIRSEFSLEKYVNTYSEFYLELNGVSVV